MVVQESSPLLGRALGARMKALKVTTIVVLLCTSLIAVHVAATWSPTVLLQTATVDGCARSEQEYAARLKSGEVDGNELQIRHYFEAADTDHSGCIDADELVEMGKLLAHTTPTGDCKEGNWCNVSKEKAKEVIDMMDTDGNGGVSYSEVLQFIALDGAFKACSSAHKGIGRGLSTSELPCAISKALDYLQLDGGARASMGADEAQDIVTLKGSHGVLDLKQFCNVFSLLILPNATPRNKDRLFNSGTPHKNAPDALSPPAPESSPSQTVATPLPSRPHKVVPPRSSNSHVVSFQCSKSKEEFDRRAAAGTLEESVAQEYKLFNAQDLDSSGCIDANQLFRLGQQLAEARAPRACAQDAMCNLSSLDAVDAVAVMDKDRAGGVSFAQVQKYFGLRKAFDACAGRKLAGALALNGPELCCAVEKVGRKYSDAECDALVHELDRHGYGYIDMSGFIDVLAKAPPSTASAGLY